MSDQTTPLRRFWAEFRENKVAVAALIVVVLMMVLALFAGLLLGGWVLHGMNAGAVLGEELGGLELKVGIAGDLVGHLHDRLGALHLALDGLRVEAVFREAFELGEEVVVEVGELVLHGVLLTRSGVHRNAPSLGR